jgi:secreted trypsin-like serine protease
VRRLLLFVTWLLSAACAIPEEFFNGRRADEIVGGTAILDGGWSAVFMIHTDYDTGTKSACTATLIAPRTLLTAAHCLDPRKGGATTAETFFQNLPVAPPSDAGTWVKASEVRFHPLYLPSNLFDYDIGLVLLPAPAATAPIPHHSADVSTLVGQPLTAIGYGITVEGTGDYGTRRAVDLTFRSVSATHIALGDQSSKGICDGDSGGPSVHRFADGGLRVVGIHNYKVPGSQCHDGLDTRVDLFSGFIQQWLNEKEDAGVSIDAGSSTDAGMVSDAGSTTDAGTATDADGGTNSQPPGSGCAAAPGAPLLGLALLSLRRRRTKWKR